MDYISWIPANNGYISRGRIKRPLIFYDNGILRYSIKNTLEYSDSFIKNIPSQYPISYDLELNINDFPLKFEIYFYIDKKYVNRDKDIRIIYAKGAITENGCINFNLQYNNLENDSMNLATSNAPTTIYTIIKNIIHSDMHHDLVVDNIIPVVKDTECNDNVVNIILKGIAEKIKQIEYESKQEFKNFAPLSKNRVIENHEKVKGIYNYYKTLKEIKNYVPENKIFPENVIASLSTLSELAKRDIEKIKYLIGILLTFLAIFISINILLKSKDFGLQNSIKFFFNNDICLINIILFSILLILFAIIDFLTTQKITSWVLRKANKLKVSIEYLGAKLILYYSDKGNSIKMPVSVFMIALLLISVGFVLIFWFAF